MEFWLRMNDQSLGGFGVPFGPWGFNSGMDVEDVRRDKAIQMGLIQKNEQVLPPDDTFNKGLKASADVEPEFLKKFLDKMGKDAYTNGEFVEIIEKLSDAPVPAPAKKVVIPQVEKMVIKGLPEPEKFQLPKPQQSFREQQSLNQNYAIKKYLNETKHVPGRKLTTPQKVKAKIDIATKKWAKTSNSFVRVKKGVLRKILEDGRFKSQHETRTSGGSLAPQARKKAETAMFSYPENLKPEKRPIYGYATQNKFGFSLDNKGNINRYSTVDMYGEIRVKLKDSTRKRTTVTFGDSLGASSYIPTPLDNPTHESQPMAGWAGEVDKAMSDNPGMSYVELQVHDGVTIDDIAHVYFPDRLWVNPEKWENLKKLLKEKGIKWTMD
jgi:hypothetical protein